MVNKYCNVVLSEEAFVLKPGKNCIHCGKIQFNEPAKINSPYSYIELTAELRPVSSIIKFDLLY